MKKKYAKRLHNGDEVILKASGEIVQVIEHVYTDCNLVLIPVISNVNGYMVVTHLDIK